MEDVQIKKIESPKSDLFYVVANPFNRQAKAVVTLYLLDHCVKNQLVSNVLCISTLIALFAPAAAAEMTNLPSPAPK
jgi:hypothetical protein